MDSRIITAGVASLVVLIALGTGAAILLSPDSRTVVTASVPSPLLIAPVEHAQSNVASVAGRFDPPATRPTPARPAVRRPSIASNTKPPPSDFAMAAPPPTNDLAMAAPPPPSPAMSAPPSPGDLARAAPPPSNDFAMAPPPPANDLAMAPPPALAQEEPKDQSQVAARPEPHPEPAPAVVPAIKPPHVVDHRYDGALTMTEIARFKSALRLTREQDAFWPPVASLLRELGRMQMAQIDAGQKLNYAMSSDMMQRFYTAASPLLQTLREDQKDVVRKRAKIMGLEAYASYI